MENQILQFQNNWNNKLNCKAFTTLRLRNDKKYHTGAKFEVQLKGVSKGTATVKAVSYCQLDKISDYFAYLDTGYPADECRKIIREMYKKYPTLNWATQDIVFVLLVFDDKKEMNNLFD
ncbi:MAG: hypothetical protein LBN93_10655 [Candidatus Symbiothrix sp.]|jgi:hypothetical protein|nr:hypothetical protein [Candidatus Symbiothrix sp.]